MIRLILFLVLLSIVGCRKINAVKSDVTVVVFDEWVGKPVKGAKVALVERKLKTSLGVGGQSNPFNCKELAIGLTDDNGIYVFKEAYLKKNNGKAYGFAILGVYDEVYTLNCDFSFPLSKKKETGDTIFVTSTSTLTVNYLPWPNQIDDSVYISFKHTLSEYHFELISDVNFLGKGIIPTRSGPYKVEIHFYKSGTDSIKIDNLFLEPKTPREYFITK